jgi:hypothetical protein
LKAKTRGLVISAGSFKVNEVNIVDYIPELVKVEYKKPISFGAPSNARSYNPDGFSDPFTYPSNITYQKKNKNCVASKLKVN